MIDNFKLSDMVRELQNIKEDIEDLKAREGAIKDAILNRYEKDIAELYAAKAEPFGAVNIMDDGVTLSVTTPKKVEWDQDKLNALYKEIGETAPEYMDVVYKVRETAFKNWPSAIQDAFIPARTIQPGATSIKWKATDNA